MSREVCPHCNRLLISPNGRIDAKILLVGEYPGHEEVKIGLPFVGQTGGVLEYEMGRIGVPLKTCRVANLWLHQKPEKAESGKDCLSYSFGRLIDELMYERDAVLFMGSDLADLFNIKLSDYIGIPLTPNSFPSLSGIKAKHIMFTYNPAQVFHSGVGEFRLSLEKFKKVLKDSKMVLYEQHPLFELEEHRNG